MQLLGKQYFRENEDGEIIGDMMREKRLLGAGESGNTDELSDGAVSRIRAALAGKDAAWYRRAWRVVKENKKHFVIAASVLVIGVAVYLNWYLYRMDNGDAIGNGAIAEAEKEALAEAGENESATGSDYFAVSQINRERARDEAIEVLQTVIEGDAAEDVINDAKASISQIASDIENEAQIETLVKSKGFDNCVAVISGECASVIVKTEGLLENEVAQIQEIVYDTAHIKPVNLKIIEK